MLKNLMSKKRKSKGFTLIELVIVIAIIAILAAVAIPKYLQVKENANEKADISNAKIIMDAAATLIADDKITTTGTNPNAVSGTAYEVKAGADTDPGNLVYNYLNKKDYFIKSVTDKGSSFSFTVDDDNNITIVATDKTDDEIAPNPTADTSWAK